MINNDKISFESEEEYLDVYKRNVFDLHTTYNSLLSSIKQDHLTELHKINLINCKITDKDIKMLKKGVKNLPNV